MQEFEFDIQHWPGKQHAVADYLSRIENRADAVDDDNDFPDGAILHIEAEDPEKTHTPHEDRWFTEMSTFLSTGLPPPRKKRKDGRKEKTGCAKPEFLHNTRYAIPQGQSRNLAQMHPQ